MTNLNEGQVAGNPRPLPDHAPSNPAPVGAGAGGRRSLLGTIATITVTSATAGAAPPCPDAELIRLARAHEQLGRDFNADFPDVDDDDHPLAIAAERRKDRNTEKRKKLLNQMMQFPPSTLEGFRSIASALVVEDLELLKASARDIAVTRLTALLVAGLLNQKLDAPIVRHGLAGGKV